MKTVEASKEVADEVHRLNRRILELEDACDHYDRACTSALDERDQLYAKCMRYEEAMAEVRDEIGQCLKRDADAYMRMTVAQVESWDIARHNQTHGWVLDRINGVLGV